LAFCSVASAEPVTPTIPMSFKTPLTAGRTFTFRFSLFDSESGGNEVWQESWRHKVSSSKRITHTLGSVIPFSEGMHIADPDADAVPVDFSQQLWVEVRGGRRFVKRVKLAVAPYALWSATSEVAGVEGAMGPQGDQGNQGLKGDKGETGSQGLNGNLALAGKRCPNNFFMTGFDDDGNLACQEVLGNLACQEVLPNNPFMLNAIGNKWTTVETLLEFTVSATDINNNALSFSADGIPIGSSFDPLSRVFSWVPITSQVGYYLVTFSVSDGSATGLEAIAISVAQDTADFLLLDKPASVFPPKKLSADGTKQKSPVVFNHTTHGTAYGCVSCHHTDTGLVTGGIPAIPCFDCHGPVAVGNQVDSFSMIHGLTTRTCLYCHKDLRSKDAACKAPTACAGCHSGGG